MTRSKSQMASDTFQRASVEPRQVDTNDIHANNQEIANVPSDELPSTSRQALNEQEILRQEEVNRQRELNSQQEQAQNSPDNNSRSTEDQRIHNIVNAIVAARTTTSAESLEVRLAQVIEQRLERSVETIMRRLNLNGCQNDRLEEHFASHINSPSAQIPSFPQDPPQFLEQYQNPSTNRGGTPQSRDFFSVSNSSRLSNLISSWEIKFDGSPNLSVENFIYRVECQTIDTLGGDFQLLCSHLQNLFTKEARNWYWRYRRSKEKITWSELCAALRKEYSLGKSDTDIKESMRARKQGINESFDEYKNAILKIAEELKRPISEEELVEIVQRGLRPRVRQQLLYVPINGSMSALRQCCIKGESLISELSKTNIGNLGGPFKTSATQQALGKRNIQELELNSEELVGEEHQLITEVEEIAKRGKLTCWNCRKEGHTYFDCLEERSLFCYGCGAIGVYKPNCVKCLSGNGRKGEISHTQSRQK